MKFKDKTRGGFPAGLYRSDAPGIWPNHGWVQNIDGYQAVCMWTARGNYRANGEPHPYDLLPLREPSEAAVEAAMKAYLGAPVHLRSAVPDMLRAAYEIDGIGGGE